MCEGGGGVFTGPPGVQSVHEVGRVTAATKAGALKERNIQIKSTKASFKRAFETENQQKSWKMSLK